MKNYLIGGLVCILAALVFGVKPVQRIINEAANRGTLRGVETCMDYSGSELISQDAVRATCVQSFHDHLYDPDVATGRAGPRTFQGKVSWGGTLENKTPNSVTTWIRVSVTVFDADGNKQEVFGETSLWIDPLGRAAFTVELSDLESEQLEKIDFCKEEVDTPKSCMAWGITEVKGLRI